MRILGAEPDPELQITFRLQFEDDV